MQSVLGAYGPWADKFLGKAPPALSLRTGKFKNVARWRQQANERVWELLAPPAMPSTPKVKVVARGTYDGLSWERLSWQLPYGPPTEAVLLKPLDTAPGRKLPAVLALHDHGGNKYFGWRKIARIDDLPHPYMEEHRGGYYGGMAWANEIAKRGHVVLIHDTFLFGSRRIHVRDTPDPMHGPGVDVGPDERTNDIKGYNGWASERECPVAKSIFCTGTTWPAIFLRDDQVALSILCQRKDVDKNRVACGGLSGGGLRTVFLAGLDERIRTCFCVGFMTTWRDLALFKSYTHTWMTYVPLLPRDLDFPEILGLRVPLSALVQNTDQDPLFTTSEARRAGAMLNDVYKRAGVADAFKFSMYKGGHKFDVPMQAEAWGWLDRWMK